METIEQLRRDYFIAHNELEQVQINVERLSAKLDEISDAEPTREIYSALASATDAARQLRDILIERRRAAERRLAEALRQSGIVPTLTMDGNVF